MKIAVILAARKERDSKIPYPLIPFAEKSKTLLDRTLDILNELSYDRIFIVCGYCKELFDKYHRDNITVLYNDDYAYTASMASLSVVRDYIHDDFVLIEGDVFYEKQVLVALTESQHPDCLAITEESGNGDEAFVQTYKGCVTKITKDKHQIISYDGEMLGLMKISYPTFTKMLNLWDSSTNLYLNYEYVFFDATTVVDRPYIYYPNLIWGDVDCSDDFYRLQNKIYPKLCRRENPFDHANLIDHLHNIFPDREVLSAQIDQIGGLSNKNFKVVLDDDVYVLRVPGNGAEGMVDRSCEDENSNKAALLGINPKVRYFNRKTGIKLVDFIPGAETLNPGTIQRKENIDMVAHILRTLHSSKVRFNNDFNVFREIRTYETLLANANAVMYSGYDDVREEIFALEDKLNNYGVQLTACHNDLVAENLVKSETGEVYLIDWEYSGMNDLHWDLAALFLENDFSPDNQEYFLHQYFGTDIPAHTYEKIKIYQILMDVLWSQWTVIKEAAGDDFGSYGPDRFARALKYLKTLA